MMRVSGAIALALVAFGCAASRTSGTDCDGGPCLLDATPADATEIDAPPGREFGEACTDNAQCDSNLCILVGTSGQCTRTCGQCPLGYGCLGVDGISIDGEITFVCVPLSNQLCTPCAADSECTLLGMDKCVTYPDGDRACGRDCTTVGCPMGYDCEDVTIGGAPYKQCMASSGACDCTATNQGAMQQCNIPTPFKVCLGTQTCAGATGWGSCAPPAATDTPDAAYLDDNCDGIDGDITAGIFVSTSGSNGASCGLVYTDPCLTISFGISRATATGRTNVYVQSGTYGEVVIVASNIKVWGGYNVQWQRGPYSTAANRVIIAGAQDNTTGGAGEYLAVRAHNVTNAQLADLIIRGPAAAGQGGAVGRDGRSSYGVHANNAQLTLTRVKIEAGAGALGATGTNGLDFSIVDATAAMDGSQGQAGQQDGALCSTSRKGGGPIGTNASCTTTAAGVGGSGGARDTDCSFLGSDFDATTGIAGGTGSSTAGGGGGTCTGNPPPGTGGRGTVFNGAGGTAATGGYLQNSLYWYARSGNGGAAGEANGGGGGGGGGAGGCDTDTDTMGAGGGGGGAGGCRAASGGAGGGGGGGGSFGVFAVGGSTVTITGCDLVRGSAATGGSGGIGGRGQSGGRGGPGGVAGPNTRAGGGGGNGGHGGHGGGGAGGQGGRSIGILKFNATVTDDCTISGGTAGSGGSGGESAPSAPVLERDGNPGANGGGGTLEPTRTCTSAASC